jgi:protoporphyrinogen oxidase
VVVIGAGPAGLTAAHHLVRSDHKPVVLEKGRQVGGIARTEVHRGYRFDIGGHRYFTKERWLASLWREMLGDDLITVARRSRIFYNGHFFDYPLEPLNALANLGVAESAAVILSYARARLFPLPKEESIEDWVVNRFGRRLYEIFFKTYTEKVWGVPCTRIHAEWAAQRIKGLSLRAAILNALFGTNRVKTLATEFLYPVQGPGMMWDRFREDVEERGGIVRTGRDALRIHHRHGRVTAVETGGAEGGELLPAGAVISSMALTDLIARLDPPPPTGVREAALALRYRSFILVALILDADGLFPDNWIYVNSRRLRLGRIQNFGNWSPGMIPVAGTSCLGLEYFCDEGDALWRSPDADLVALATRELGELGLAGKARVLDGAVIRQEKAYPLYGEGYRDQLQTLREWLSGLENLQTIGRNGMHRYNNMDHSMLTGLMAAENVLGAAHDIWEVNRRPEYHEEVAGTGE